MAEIVAAVACSHAPGVVMHPQSDAAGAKDRWFAAMEEARARLERARPDAVLVISNEHIQNFFFHNWPTFAVVFPEEMEGPFEKHLPMPRYHVRGYPEFGRYLLEEGLQAHFDLSSSQEFEPDHGVFIPLGRLRPQMDLPLTVLLQNCVEPPLPTLRRCEQLGRFVGEAIRRWPHGDRFAVVAVGGLSHWIGVKHMGEINQEWDRWALDLICRGRTDELAKLTTEQIERDAGNGGQEIRNWLTLMAAVDSHPAELLAYEAVRDWVVGCGVVYWDLAGNGR